MCSGFGGLLDLEINNPSKIYNWGKFINYCT